MSRFLFNYSVSHSQTMQTAILHGIAKFRLFACVSFRLYVTVAKLIVEILSYCTTR